MHILCILTDVFVQKKSKNNFPFLLTSYMAQRRMPAEHTSEERK